MARKMKDSGIAWIGEIPEEWNIMKMNRVCSIVTDYVASGSFADLAENVQYLDEPDYAMLVRTADVSQKGHVSKPVYINKHAYEFLRNSNLYGGELLLPNIGAIGDIYVVPKLYEKMSLAPNAIICKTNYCDKYYYYYFYCEAGKRSLIEISQSTAQAKFNKTDFKQIRGLVPSVDEQVRIASFLDKECARIDSIIEQTRASIEEYKALKQSVITEAVTKGIRPGREMKDSGIEWIGEIPTEWNVVRLKSYFDFGKGLPITKDNLIETGVPVISYGQIHSKLTNGVEIQPHLLRFVDESYLSSNPQSLVHKGDFIFADTSEDLDGCGNAVYINKDSILFAGYHTIIFSGREHADNKYLAYLFRTDAWRSQIRSKVSGVKVFSISRRILGDATFIAPTQEEAKEIVKYLDVKCAEIDRLVTKKQDFITEMEYYKRSLIYEYVTGKKEVM